MVVLCVVYKILQNSANCWVFDLVVVLCVVYCVVYKILQNSAYYWGFHLMFVFSG